MIATERIEAEQHFHDVQARQRAGDLSRRAQGLVFSDAEYLDHESWIKPAMARLGPVAGRSVLDFGCGHGMAAVVLARRGAQVTALDLSAGYLAEARRRAEANCVTIETVQADGHFLPFADATFDAIWGNAILHHLDLALAGVELRRVLRTGGMAVFCEPWGENRLLRFARRCLPYPGKNRTRDEEPLRRRDLEFLREAFPNLDVSGYQLLSMLRRAVHVPAMTALLESCDRHVLQLPWAKNWCRYVVLTMRRE
jgi:ubiquinone/menaquinone biosynthesis C-methylase UbiE